MSRLNGPNSLSGASKLKMLKLEVVVQLMEIDHINACYVAFADLLAALVRADLHYQSASTLPYIPGNLQTLIMIQG